MNSPAGAVPSGMHGHLPRIDGVHLVGTVARELDRLRPRVQAVEQVVFAGLGQQEPALVVAQRLEFVERRGLRHEVLQPLDAFRAFAVQHAAFGPPEDVLGMLVGFAVADVAAAERAEPEPLGHLPRGQVAPALRDVALVLAFVVDDRLAILLAEPHAAVHVGGLQAGMRDPGLGVVVPFAAVVNAAQPLVRVLLLEDGEEPVPVLPLLVAAMALGPLGHEIVFVGQRPPDVAEGREPRDAVAQIAVVLRVAHVGEAPAVVGVPEDQVRLDAQPLQVQDALFEMPPETPDRAG